MIIDQTPTQHTHFLHYTTATGLLGIIESKFIRATHSGYVNDSTECKAFFTDKLPQLLKVCVEKLDEEGVTLAPDAVYNLRHMIEGIQSQLNSYLISFCGSTAHDMENGLLSQWRGYGSDGGYAIVFEALKLNDLLIEELNRFHLGMASLCEVEYYPSVSADKYYSQAMSEQESKCLKALESFLRTNDFEHWGEIFKTTLVMSHMHKHSGFKEEQEVRVVILPLPDDAWKAGSEEPSKDKELPNTCFYDRAGLIIPYLKVFEGNHLPISKVIVGPHHDAERRCTAVEKLLNRNGYTNVNVIKSKIPYLGR